MLVLVKFTSVVHESKTVVSLETSMGNRVDVSKKFMKREINDQYIFSKSQGQELIIKFDEYYVIEASNRVQNPDVKMMQDLISVSQINAWLTIIKDMAKNAVEVW